MLFQIKNPLRKLLHFSLFAFLFILHFTGNQFLTLRSASPFLMLPLLTAYSMFKDELSASVVGAVVGAFVDSVSNTPACFHTVVLFVLCFMTSLISKYLFNINYRSAIVLSILGNTFYYLARWIVCYAFSTPITDSLIYIFEYALPSIVFNAVFVLAFFFIERKFNKAN